MRVANTLLLLTCSLIAIPSASFGQEARARHLGIPFEGIPGPFNAITDVDGVEVGHVTLIRGDGPLVKGEGPVRTGVTAILPRGRRFDPVFAGIYALNGNGEMTGTHWVEESGFLETPILITNTFSVGVVRDAVIAWMDSTGYNADPERSLWYTYPVVAETYDILNDILGQHVTRQHAFEALNNARGGPVSEGNVGGGTGMMAHGFKAGIGTASRLTGSGHTLGVLVQANYGDRSRFTVAGVPVGRAIPDLRPNFDAIARGSIIVVVATDAPLLPQQLERIAQRVPLAIGRLGGLGGNGSGDLFIAFSTANPNAWHDDPSRSLEMLPNGDMDALFEATVEATEEAILNSMVAAETMTGRDSLTVYALPHDRLQEALREHNRWVEPGSLPEIATLEVEEVESILGRYRSNVVPGEPRIYLDDGKLYIDIGAARRRVVRLTNGRFLLLGTGGHELEPVLSDSSTLLRMILGGEVIAELERIERE